MDILYLIGGTVAIALLGYLVYALIKAEDVLLPLSFFLALALVSEGVRRWVFQRQLGTPVREPDATGQLLGDAGGPARE